MQTISPDMHALWSDQVRYACSVERPGQICMFCGATRSDMHVLWSDQVRYACSVERPGQICMFCGATRSDMHVLWSDQVSWCKPFPHKKLSDNGFCNQHKTRTACE
ncbi:hypothetical protein DPMN_101057 [Dreissena polymorpha]|uniref:Uncharacterized protein n=1 Tax=Dreissena polymorpha TaxID=45954 RepID=A0A9D4R7Z6_DREPO|nr:hypothetical protein DPMN_101057 [Dreissena polymorpha]